MLSWSLQGMRPDLSYTALKTSMRNRTVMIADLHKVKKVEKERVELIMDMLVKMKICG